MLLDSHGNPIQSARKPKRPKSGPSKPRVSSKQTQIARRNLAPVTHVTITLLARHNLSDHVYGPGTVTVPIDVARTLQEHDQRAQRTDYEFASTKACVIGPGRVKGGVSVTRVAPEFFDTQYASAVPFGVVDRNTATFQPH